MKQWGNYQYLFSYEGTTPKDFWVLERKQFPLFAKVSLRLCNSGTKEQMPLKNVEKIKRNIARK